MLEPNQHQQWKIIFLIAFWGMIAAAEDDVIRAIVSNDGDSEEGDDNSGGESENSDNGLAPESIFIKTKSSLVTTNYNRVRFI